MGWDSSYDWNTKQDVVNNLLESFRKSEWKVHAKKSNKDGFWAVVENTSGCKFIYFARIERFGKAFAVKTMTEHMGPSYYSCPVNFLDIADKPSESEKYAIEWREKVLEKSKIVARKPEIGQKIKLYGKFYIVIELRKKTYIVTTLDGNNRYRLSQGQLSQWEEVTPLEKALLEIE